MVETIFVLNRNKNVIGFLSNNGVSPTTPFFDDIYNQDLSNGTETYEFSTWSNSITSNMLDLGNYIVFQYDNKHKLFQIMDIDEGHKDGEQTIICYCEMAGLELLTDYCEPFNIEGNVELFFNTVLQDTNWVLGRYSGSLVANIQQVKIDKYSNVYKVIQDNLATFGNIEIEYRVEFDGNRLLGYAIDVYGNGERGNPAYKRFEYGENVDGISRKGNLYDFSSAMIGIGKENLTFKDIEWSTANGDPADKPLGQDFIVDLQANDKFNKHGKYIKGIYENSDINNGQDLLLKTWEKLQEVKEPKFDYEVSLALTSSEYEDIKIGDTNYVIDNDYNPPIFLEARVGKLEISFSDRLKNKCTLSNYKEVESNIRRALSDMEISDMINSNFPIGSDKLQDGSIIDGKIDVTYYKAIKTDIIQASVADVQYLIADKANISDLVASNIKFNTATGGTLTLDTLLSKFITGENGQFLNITSDNVVIANAVIKDIIAKNMSIEDLQAGKISTTKFNISSDDGGMEIVGATQQFKDKNNKIRLQLGQDAQGDFNFILKGEDGTTTLIDHAGIKENAIANDLIKENMVAQDAIGEKQINYSSLIAGLNKDTNINTIKSTKIMLDNQAQTLDIAFGTLKTQADETKSATESNTTQLGIEQGRINTLIKDTTIEKDGATVLLKDAYSKTEQTVNDHTTTIGRHESTLGAIPGTYATQSSVTQTADDVINKFTQSGGINLLKNSAFKNGYANWNYLRWDSTAGGNAYIEVVYPQYNEWTPSNRNSLCACVTNLPSSSAVVCLRNGFDSDQFDVKPSTTYSLNCLMASHRAVSYTIEMLCYDSNGSRISDDNHSVSIDSPKSGGRDRNNWNKIKHTWTTQSNAATCMFRAFMNEWTGVGNSAFMWICEPIIIEGDVDIFWMPNSDEVYTGISTLDLDGLTVAMIDGEGSKGSSRVSYEGITTYDQNGNIKSWFSDDNAFIKELNVDIINNPYLIQSKPRNTDWYVGQYATGDGTGRDTSNKSNSINSVFQYIKNNYGVYSFRQDINIVCDNGINLNEDIYIGGWIGSGVIQISFGDSSSLTGNILIEECTPYIYLYGGGVWGNNNGCMWYRTGNGGNGSALGVRNSTVYCTGFRTHSMATYDYPFLFAFYGATVMLYAMDFVKYWAICHCFLGTNVYMDMCRGDVGILCEKMQNSNLVARSSLPIFNTGKDIYNFWNSTATYDGTAGSNSLWYPKDVSTPAPTQSWHWVEKTFYFNLSSTTEGTGSTTSGWSDKWGQGKWGSYKPHRGHAVPTENINSWLGGSYRNVTMVLTMTRLSSNHGNYGAVPVPKLKQKDGSYWNCEVAFALGNTKSITLSSGVVSGLSDGTLSELTMWAGTSTDNYSQYNNVSLKVTCEKYY